MKTVRPRTQKAPLLQASVRLEAHHPGVPSAAGSVCDVSCLSLSSESEKDRQSTKRTVRKAGSRGTKLSRRTSRGTRVSSKDARTAVRQVTLAPVSGCKQ